METKSDSLVFKSIMSLDRPLFVKTDNLALMAECFFVPELNGELNFFNAEKVFFSRISSLFTAVNRCSKAMSSSSTLINLYKLTKDSTSSEIFQSFEGIDLSTIALTQGQIVLFCQQYKEYLIENTDTILFLLKEGKQYFIAKTSFSHAKILVSVFSFDNDNFRWYSLSGHSVALAI